MIGAEAAIIGLVAGAIGGSICAACVSVFMEAYFGRRASEEVGVYDVVEQPTYRH